MNTQPLVRHMAMAPAITPVLRWDGVTPIDTHRVACTEALRDLLGMDTFAPCEPVFEITSEDTHRGNRHKIGRAHV